MARLMDRSKIVVVLEDDHEARSLLASVLQEDGYYVIPVDRGERVLEVLQQVRASLLITDLLLPGMDGNEVIRQIRADEKTRDIPVITLSAHLHKPGSGSRGGLSRNAGKPRTIGGLVAEVERIIGKPGEDGLILAQVWAPAS